VLLLNPAPVVIIGIVAYLLLKQPTPAGTYGAGFSTFSIPGVGSYTSGPLGSSIQLASSLFNGLLTPGGQTPSVLQTQTVAPYIDPSTAAMDTVDQAGVISATPDPYGINAGDTTAPIDLTPIDTADPLVADAFFPTSDPSYSLLGAT
jgi:hypothetical protein